MDDLALDRHLSAAAVAFRRRDVGCAFENTDSLKETLDCVDTLSKNNIKGPDLFLLTSALGNDLGALAGAAYLGIKQIQFELEKFSEKPECEQERKAYAVINKIIG